MRLYSLLACVLKFAFIFCTFFELKYVVQIIKYFSLFLTSNIYIYIDEDDISTTSVGAVFDY